MCRADRRSIISTLADRVGSPLLLEDVRQRTVAYNPQDQAVDELRKEAIPTGSLSPEIMAWSDSFGIRTARGPVRTPPDPERGSSRACPFPCATPASCSASSGPSTPTGTWMTRRWRS